MVVVVDRQLSGHTDTGNVFAVGWSHPLNGMFDEVLSWNAVAGLAVAVVGMSAAQVSLRHLNNSN
jgi:hypothetical protein